MSTMPTMPTMQPLYEVEEEEEEKEEEKEKEKEKEGEKEEEEKKEDYIAPETPTTTRKMMPKSEKTTRRRSCSGSNKLVITPKNKAVKTTTTTAMMSVEEFTEYLALRRQQFQQDMVEHTEAMKQISVFMAQVRKLQESLVKDLKSVEDSLRALDLKELEKLKERTRLMQMVTKSPKHSIMTSHFNHGTSMGGASRCTFVTVDEEQELGSTNHQSKAGPILRLEIPCVQHFPMEHHSFEKKENFPQQQTWASSIDNKNHDNDDDWFSKVTLCGGSDTVTADSGSHLMNPR